jgi:hypothetical protein
MERFNELLEKRRNLTADIFEEEELIELSKSMTEEELKDVDKSLLTHTNSDRLDKISSLLDRLSEVIDKSKQK